MTYIHPYFINRSTLINAMPRQKGKPNKIKVKLNYLLHLIFITQRNHYFQQYIYDKLSELSN